MHQLSHARCSSWGYNSPLHLHLHPSNLLSIHPSSSSHQNPPSIILPLSKTFLGLGLHTQQKWFAIQTISAELSCKPGSGSHTKYWCSYSSAAFLIPWSDTGRASNQTVWPDTDFHTKFGEERIEILILVRKPHHAQQVSQHDRHTVRTGIIKLGCWSCLHQQGLLNLSVYLF